MGITTVNLSDGQLRDLRKLGVENISSLMRRLVRSHIISLRSSKKEFISRFDKLTEKLGKVQKEWFVIELARARKRGEKAAILHYERLLGEGV